MISNELNIALVRKAVSGILEKHATLERVTEGSSTYVYRVREKHRILYLRILPEDASFAIEVHVHKLLQLRGLHVPQVLYYEERNPLLGLSLMLTEEIPGSPVRPPANPEVFRAAGREIAIVHSIPVTGFGWIDRNHPTSLYGVSPSFEAFYAQDIDHGMACLTGAGICRSVRDWIHGELESVFTALQTQSARLVHGDFDISHIFQLGGNYTGLIDFGEIMGNAPLYDLALFRFYSDLSEDESGFSSLVEGYHEITPLSLQDLRTIDAIALFFGVWKYGKKQGVNPAFANFLLERVLRQHERLTAPS